jgi:hypothetical protein
MKKQTMLHWDEKQAMLIFSKLTHYRIMAQFDIPIAEGYGPLRPYRRTRGLVPPDNLKLKQPKESLLSAEGG